MLQVVGHGYEGMEMVYLKWKEAKKLVVHYIPNNWNGENPKWRTMVSEEYDMMHPFIAMASFTSDLINMHVKVDWSWWWSSFKGFGCWYIRKSDLAYWGLYIENDARWVGYMPMY